MGEKEGEYIFQIVKDSDGAYCYIKQGEIIRCKDCKFWETTWAYGSNANLHYCPLVDGVRREDFYCADAEERRTDE